METSKVARISSLTEKTRLLADFSNPCCPNATPGASTIFFHNDGVLRPRSLRLHYSSKSTGFSGRCVRGSTGI